MRFCSKMDNSTNIIFFEKILNQIPVTNISFYKSISLIIFNLFQVFKISGIGKQI